MTNHAWINEFPGAVTVCDNDGIILEMNGKSAQVFEADGGQSLIGSNLLDCHPMAARAKLEHLMQTQERNVYTIEKNGVKKLIYQSPWYVNGQVMGFVELALEIPFELPHFMR